MEAELISWLRSVVWVGRGCFIRMNFMRLLHEDGDRHYVEEELGVGEN